MNKTLPRFMYLERIPRHLHTGSRAAITYAAVLCFLVIYSCNSAVAPKDIQIINSPEQMDEKVSQNIHDLLNFALQNKGSIDDSLELYLPTAVNAFYKSNEFKNAWSEREQWKPAADSIFWLVEHAEYYGLFPKEYHGDALTELKKTLADSLQRMNAVLWSTADLLLTDGYMKILKHVKQGRLLPDSISLSSDTLMNEAFFLKHTNELYKEGGLSSILEKLEPKHKGYAELKKAIPAFLDSVDRRVYTYVPYPSKDSIGLIKKLQKRLNESGYLPAGNKLPDSASLATALKKFQKSKNLTSDGKMGAATAKALNTSGIERFKRIAITLDRYKQLPETLPEKYLWVNLPGYYLRLWDNDTIALESKVIVGKPYTRTPTLNSEISDMITYPQWTIPTSIIKKEILPGLKRNPGYLARRNFSLINSKGEVVDPYSVNWAKYSSGIPFKVRQGSGDDNALGIFKFNFDNPYSVYLHDTNQRYLFKNKDRALSHGCVRVQEWEKLAFYIARNDSMNTRRGDSLTYTPDSIRNWLAKKERRRVLVKNRIPIYIRYFTCEGKDGKVVFYDDIYSEDKKLREQYFSN